MLALIAALTLTQAPPDVPRAKLAPPRLELLQSSPLQAHMHLVPEDPAQGSYRWREIGAGVAGAAAGYLASIQVAFVALKLSPQAHDVRWLGYDVRYSFAPSNPPGAANLLGGLTSLTLPNLGAALGALWAADGPHSGGFWRAILYGYAGQLAVFVGEVVAAALVGSVIGQQQLPTAETAIFVGAIYATPGVMSSFGLHDGEPRWAPAPVASF